MKVPKFLVLIGLISLMYSELMSQAKYDKAIKATEDKYETGDYRKAISALEKFKAKAFKKLGPQNAYTANYHYSRPQSLYQHSLDELLRSPVGYLAREGQYQHVLDSLARQYRAAFCLRG